MEPFFSVVIPTYNRAGTISDTLLSVKAQTFRDFECLIVDDGSRDSVELCSVVREIGDDRFRVVHRDNGGGGAARNSGIDAAVGQFVAFLDSDDVFLPEKLQQAYDAILGRPDRSTHVYFSQVFVERGVGNSWIKPSRAPGSDERIDEYLILRAGFIQTSTIVIGRELAAMVRFDEALPFGQDTDFCIRVADRGGRFEMLSPPTVVWKDDTAVNRVSSNSRYEKILDWTDRNRSILTARTYYAYRGWHGAKAAYAVRPGLAISLYLAALMRGAFAPQLALRVALQIFVSPDRYRSFANVIVKLFGTKREGV